VDDFLAGAGWQRFDDTRVLVLPELTGQSLTAHREVHQTTQADYVEIVGELRGSPPAQCRAHLERLAACPVTYEGFVLRVGGKVAACGQLVLEDGLVGLYDVVTAASERGRGLARLVCMHLLATAKNRGAKAAYLQVDAGNVPALALYRKLGFREGYGYHYRSPDPSAA
jgi:ribosomal protein S18 acetylase RimI-like enzyme